MNLNAEYEYKIGIGTDLHVLIPDRDLILGGTKIPFPMGLKGHSDGDAAIHAVIDAILGAAGLGDIGTLFPDTDEDLKNIDSLRLLSTTSEIIAEKNWQIANLDLTITAQQPRLEPFKQQMKRAIASAADINFNNVNVKAKTNEGVDAVGEGRAISALAIVMLQKRKRRTL